MEVGALPAGLRAEDGAGLLEPAVERREPARPAGDVGVVRDSAAGSSRCRSRGPGPPRRPGRGRCRRTARPGTARCRRRGRRSVIQPAIARPIPPPPPKPLSDSPAATQNPRTPGSGPRSGFASGRHRVGVADEADRPPRRRGTGSAGSRRPSAARSARSRAAASVPRDPTGRRPPSATRGSAS